MPMLFESPGRWTCEHTDKGIFYVRILMRIADAQTLDTFMETARPHLERLQPVLYMNDATFIQEGPLALHWRLSTHMKANAKLIKRSAVFGLTPARAFFVRSVIRASGRNNVKIFDTREKCERWLLEASSSNAA